MTSVEEFSKNALSFLEANAKKRVVEKSVWGEGSDVVAVLPEKTDEEEEAEVTAAKEWAQKVFDAGFGWITGPKEFGGAELSDPFARSYMALEAQYDTAPQSCRGIGLGMVAPTILAHGTQIAKEKYLRSLYRGDIIACQLFSEPGAGSDLASVSTFARRDGDEWVLNGQKVWTSGAHYSQIGEILCRTNLEAPKHRGLTAFIVDMKAPGVSVRPLRQMTGGASFNEVFFTDVRVPDDHRLGDVDEGWTVALTTLMNERAAIGGGGGGVGAGSMSQRLMELVKHVGNPDDPLVRQKLVDIYMNARVAQYTNQRAMAKIAKGQLPGPEMSIAKLSLTENMRRICDYVSSVLGMRIIADTNQWGTYGWSTFILGVPGMRVAGGTDEVMKNIVAERVLRLP
ncbi:MAG: acyl-CoA dehydrogenase, partial [Acidimicrobiales bacterium]|nr:acyl-CoA dehydrogenase [Acidimicrobiales bacterium]